LEVATALTGSRPLALITGASRGVGAAVAQRLSQSHDIILGGRDRRALADLADRIPAASPWPVELADLDAVAVAAADIERLGVLVHSAGVWEPGQIGETTPDMWRRIFDVNVFAVAELTRLLLPALRLARGRVILINSTAGQRASPSRGAYAASKFALRAFGDALRAEEAENGVGVTSIYPGRIATDMQRRVRQDEGGRYLPDQYLNPDSIAYAVLAAVNAPAGALLTEITVAPTPRTGC
jgi:NADP-dependent 3-hydroxy acid dehydrogenase YdfG